MGVESPDEVTEAGRNMRNAGAFYKWRRRGYLMKE